MDLLYNFEFLFSNEYDVNNLSIGAIKLNSDFRSISLENAVDIYINDYDSSNDNFATRFSKFTDHDGWIHLAGGITFGITDQKINHIKLYGKSIENVSTLKRDDIENRLGKPEKELIEDFYFGSIEAIILVYKQRQLYFFLDPSNNNIKEIHIGTLNEKAYSKKLPGSTLNLGRSWLKKLFFIN